jgi:hypothetical protein
MGRFNCIYTVFGVRSVHYPSDEAMISLNYLFFFGNLFLTPVCQMWSTNYLPFQFLVWFVLLDISV